MFYHYKGPRQTKLSGVIPCQKFFDEPVLITTFVLSGRFYHRSKKDVIRLSMTTVTDVDCLNIITIRLSIVFGDCMQSAGDCMQSADVKSNLFYAIFSSAEPLGSQGELIVNPSRRRPSTRPPFSKIVSETTLPIKAKVQTSSPESGTKVCINAQGRMTKMDTTPMYGKKL